MNLSNYFIFDGRTLGMLIISVGSILTMGILTFKLNNSLDTKRRKRS